MRRNINRYLVVDGYNIINAWDELRDTAKDDLENAREKLISDISFVHYKTSKYHYNPNPYSKSNIP